MGGTGAVEQVREAAALGLHPVVIEAWQQLAGVERDGPRMPVFAHAGFERDHVTADGAGYHAREELIDLVWPGVALDVGRNRLRQALFTLRQWLEPPGASGSPSAVT